MKLPGPVIGALVALWVTILALVIYVALVVNLGVALGALVVAVVLFIAWLMSEEDRRNPRKVTVDTQPPERYPEAVAQPAPSQYTSAPDYSGGQ